MRRDVAMQAAKLDERATLVEHNDVVVVRSGTISTKIRSEVVLTGGADMIVNHWLQQEFYGAHISGAINQLVLYQTFPTLLSPAHYPRILSVFLGQSR